MEELLALRGFGLALFEGGGGAFAFALALSFTCPWLPVRGPWSSCLSLPGKYISYEIGLLRLYEAGTPTCAPAFGGLTLPSNRGLILWGYVKCLDSFPTFGC